MVLDFSRMEDSNCRQRVAIDMQFESLMRPKDIRHLFVQLAHAYAVNRRAQNPLQFSVVGFSGSQNKVLFLFVFLFDIRFIYFFLKPLFPAIF